MTDAKYIYELLLDYANSTAKINQLCLGLVWTACEINSANKPALGLAMSPQTSTRTLDFSGTLVGKSINEIATWITDWNPYKATIGMAAINCSINNHRVLPQTIPLASGNLAVFEHFLPQLKDKKVVVIGRYPNIEKYSQQLDLHILERQPIANDYPDPACEYLLPTADWVFLSATTITNKTFPRLAELSQQATTVLMGATVPWLPELHEFGIDYLAGINVSDSEHLYQTVAEGGGVRIFENGAQYQIADLRPETSLSWLKAQIAQTYTQRDLLNQAMEKWYAQGESARFPEFAELKYITERLSRMDSSYKKLWDSQAIKPL